MKQVRLNGGHLMCRMVCAILTVALVMALTHVKIAKAQIGIDKSVGAVRGWNIGLSDNTGGCLATTSYTDGTNIFVGFSGKGTPYLAFTNSGWTSIKPKRRYKVSLNMPGYGNWKGVFIGFKQMDGKGLFGLNIKAEFIGALMGARGVIIYLGQRRITGLSLKGSSAAIQKVFECQKSRPNRTSDPEPSPSASKEDSEGGTGTGFFVSAQGHVLTNHHVAGKCGRASVRTGDGVQLKASLVASDVANDLALLATGYKGAPRAPFARSVRLGSSVYVFGYPLSGLLASSGNFTTGAVTALAGINDNSTMLQISAPIQPGNSGGALLNDQGAVVGVVKSKLDALGVAGVTSDIAQNVNFAIKSSLALNFLETANIEPQYIDSGETLSPADIADRAKKFSVQVICEVGSDFPSSKPSSPAVRAEAAENGMRIERGKAFVTAGYRPAGATTLDECAMVCRREVRCLAFQFSSRPIYDQRVHRDVQCRLYDDAANLDAVASEDNIIGYRINSGYMGSSTTSSGGKPATFSEHRSRALEGGDLKILKGETESGCKATCIKDNRCSAYSYDRWNNYCFLKAELGRFRRDPRYLTAVRGGMRLREAPTPHSIRKRSNKYFPSASYQTRNAHNFDACGEICLDDVRCDAISYQRRSGECRLLSEPSEYFDKPGNDIGLRLQEP